MALLSGKPASFRRLYQAPSTLEGTEIPFTEIDTHCGDGFAFPIPANFTI